MSNYRRLFIKGYNYIFFTIVTFNRDNILIDNIDILRSAFKYAMLKINFKVYACCILKNHLHLIIELKDTKNYPKIIRLMKYYFSRHINKTQNSYFIAQ